ncbi:saccharopine dehydrogenase NADP-binding domain-containing protein [Saccharomonospora sp. NPDC006951]
MRRVVVLGGYGAVGREVVAGLRGHIPEIVVGGRDLARASAVTGAVPLRFDLREDDLSLLDADAVVMCAEQDNVRVARACLARGIHYVDVSADHDVLTAIERFDSLAVERKATAVLSVGLVPGVTNLLANSLNGEATDIGVLLGLGEHHGPSAVKWTLDALGDVGESWRMRFPEPYGNRTVHGFPFSDQFTLPGRVRTGLCLDSRVVSALLPRFRKVRNAKSLNWLLRKVHFGRDGFAVAAASDGKVKPFSGRRQSRATGLVAAMVVSRLEGLPPGVRHIENAVGTDFLPELASHGFSLHAYEAT